MTEVRILPRQAPVRYLNRPGQIQLQWEEPKRLLIKLNPQPLARYYASKEHFLDWDAQTTAEAIAHMQRYYGQEFNRKFFEQTLQARMSSLDPEVQALIQGQTITLAQSEPADRIVSYLLENGLKFVIDPYPEPPLAELRENRSLRARIPASQAQDVLQILFNETIHRHPERIEPLLEQMLKSMKSWL